MAVLKNTTLSFQFLNTLKSLSDLNIFYSFFLNLTWFFKFILMMMTILFLKWLFLTDKRESYYQYSTAEEFVDKKIEDVGKVDSKEGIITLMVVVFVVVMSKVKMVPLSEETKVVQVVVVL